VTTGPPSDIISAGGSVYSDYSNCDKVQETKHGRQFDMLTKCGVMSLELLNICIIMTNIALMLSSFVMLLSPN